MPPNWRQRWLPTGVLLPTGALLVVLLLVSTTVKMSIKGLRGEMRMRMKQQNAQIEALNADIHRLHTRIDQMYGSPPSELP